jgi:fimbrial chaperone protein
MRSLVSALLLLLACPAAGDASSLRVSPALLNVTAPAAAAALTLQNGDKNLLNAQVRVYRWRQVGGTERLEPTSDVVASPPFATLAEGADYVVRIVRVSKVPISTEESYRVLIDELPNPAVRHAGTITFVLRYSVPVFFTTANAAPVMMSWSVQPDGAFASPT